MLGVTEYDYDMVVLFVGFVIISRNGVIKTDHRSFQECRRFPHGVYPKLRPVDTLTDGVYLAGVSQGPKDIPDV